MIENIYLVEQTNEVNVRIISTKSTKIGTALCNALELGDEAVIDSQLIEDDDGDKYLVYIVSEDGVNWHHSFRVYEEEEGKKVKNSLLWSGRPIVTINNH